MLRKIILLLFLILGWQTKAQELNCVVNVEASPQIQLNAMDKEVFEAMEQTIFDFMNNTKWSEDVFEIEERIDCNIAITIMSKDEKSQNFTAKIQVQSTRPVFKTSFNSVLFSHLDEDFAFEYQRNAQLRFFPERFQDNLTSVLAFYAYMILAYDYDSFSFEGGTPYFNLAQQVVSNASQSVYDGWKSEGYGSRNRFRLIDNAQQGLFDGLRKCFYEYHRLGMDKMVENKEEARKTMATSLGYLKLVHDNRPGSMNVQSFLLGKQREIVNLFSQAPSKEKNEIVQLLKKIDPSNSSEYEKILSAR